METTLKKHPRVQQCFFKWVRSPLASITTYPLTNFYHQTIANTEVNSCIQSVCLGHKANYGIHGPHPPIKPNKTSICRIIEMFVCGSHHLCVYWHSFSDNCSICTTRDQQRWLLPSSCPEKMMGLILLTTCSITQISC